MKVNKEVERTLDKSEPVIKRPKQNGKRRSNESEDEVGRKRDEKKQMRPNGGRIASEGEEKICIWFAKGKTCRYREGCRYVHKRLCRWVKIGQECRNQKCRFGHDRSVICRWNREGDCRFGEHCKYLHENVKKEGQEKEEGEIVKGSGTKGTARREENSMVRMSAWEECSVNMEERIIERLRDMLKYEMRQMRMGEANFWGGQDQKLYRQQSQTMNQTYSTQ